LWYTSDGAKSKINNHFPDDARITSLEIMWTHLPLDNDMN
jgi:hypothetical protein